MKRTIEPNIIDRGTALPSGEGADSPPNDQGRNSPAAANAGSPVPQMVGGSPVGGQTPLPVEGLVSVTSQSPSSVASSGGFGGMLGGPVSNPQLMVRNPIELAGSATLSPSHATSPMLPTASSLTVVPQREVEEQFHLGLQAYGTDDFKQAAMWFQQAAKQGHAAAHYYLGRIYQYGQGLKQDYDKAIALYKKAAELGQADAQFTLGWHFFTPCKGETDMKQSIKWFRMAAEQGHPGSQLNLGGLYETAGGIEQDLAQAAFWYSQAAEQGQEIAVNSLSRVSRIIKALNDFEREAGEYREAAEHGDPDAQYKLGRICESFHFPKAQIKGEGRITNLEIEKDYSQKIKNQGIVWYLQAAEQGHVKAQFKLASIYREDEDIEDHMGQAVKWYLKAAEQGHVKAQSILGYFYRNGKGVEQNFEQAVMWYQKAVDKGDDEARELLGFMYAEGEGVKQDFYKAAYLQMLGNLQNSDGDQKSVAVHDGAPGENGSILDYILDVLRDYPEFKGVTRVIIQQFTATEVSCSAVDRLIRSDSDIQRLWIVFPDPNFNTGDITAVDVTDFVKNLAESIRVSNTRLTHLDFEYTFVDDAALTILNQVLHRNKSIAELRGYLQQHPAVHSDALPLEVLMPLADQLIVNSCRSGQSVEAVKAALDEFLMSVQAERLNVPIRQPAQ